MLVFHMPKTHTSEKFSSGRFEKTYSGGSLKYYLKSKKLVLQTPTSSITAGLEKHGNMSVLYNDAEDDQLQWNMRGLWDDFCKDPTPKWEAVAADPRSFDDCIIPSGKNQGKKYIDCYGKTKVSKYVEWLLRGEEDSDPSRGKTSLGMRLFYEYCRARFERHAHDIGTRTVARKRPAAVLENDGILMKRPAARTSDAELNLNKTDQCSTSASEQA